jgi:hypothetical protein
MAEIKLALVQTKIWVSEKNVKVKHYKRKQLNPGIRKSILSWFNGPQGYFMGVLLLTKISSKSILIQRLMKGETKRNRNKLINELSNAIELLRIPEPNGKR